MPRGVYQRKSKGESSPPRRRRLNGGDGYADLLATMRAEKTKAEDRVVALGTAIEALEGIDEGAGR
jgi:hypothetical protein